MRGVLLPTMPLCSHFDSHPSCYSPATPPHYYSYSDSHTSYYSYSSHSQSYSYIYSYSDSYSSYLSTYLSAWCTGFVSSSTKYFRDVTYSSPPFSELLRPFMIPACTLTVHYKALCHLIRLIVTQFGLLAHAHRATVGNHVGQKYASVLHWDL